jgi:hypothetical protein
VAFGLLSFFILPRTPTSSRFLTEKEKEAIRAALEEDWTPDSEDEEFSWRHVIAAFTTPHVSLCYYIRLLYSDFFDTPYFRRFS